MMSEEDKKKLREFLVCARKRLEGGQKKTQRLKDCMFTRVAVTRGAQTSITHLFNKLPCSGPSNDGV